MARKFDIIRVIFGNYASKINKNALRRGLFFFVAVPTFVSAFYYLLIASDIYISEIKFSVNVEGGQSSLASQIGASLMPSMSPVANLQEARVVKEFIHSYTMLDVLESNMDLNDVFNRDGVDFLSNLSSRASKEKKLEYLQEMITIELDEMSAITTVQVRAFTPEDAQKIAMIMVDKTEEEVNSLSRRVQDEAISFSKRDLNENELKVIESNEALTIFRNKNKNFDPTITTEGVLSIIGSLESELASTQTQIAEYRNYMQAKSPQISAMEAKARSLSEQIKEQTKRIANEGGAPLADLVQEYEKLKTLRDLSLARYEVSLRSLEAAQVDARKKSKYLIRIVEPTLPETSQEPRRLKLILTVFLLCLIGYSIAGLVLAAIKDHNRP